MAHHVLQQNSVEDAPNEDAETRRLKATLPDDMATYAEDLAGSLGCSISSLAEAFLRAHRARPVEGLAVRAAEVERRVEREKSARGRVAIGRARKCRWPGKGDEGGGFITAADGFLDEE
jgi:hypothetical protein